MKMPGDVRGSFMKLSTQAEEQIVSLLDVIPEESYSWRPLLWTAERDWVAIKSINSMLMSFADRPHLIYKTIPFIYHRVPAEEDRYSLFRVGGLLHRRDVLAVVDGRTPLGLQTRRRR